MRSLRAVLRGVETTPWRWFHTWRVTQTSRTPQVDTTVPPTLASTMGNASDEPATVQKNATVVAISVNDPRITARTAAVRTGSGSLRVPTGSSTHSSPPGPRRSAVPISTSLPLPTVGRIRSLSGPTHQ
ncbi:hypothetical protein SAMN05421806_10319 [Streptomyces indicus]|uniref:Uncharacterized protein n=1 Tax=Streptomyces indicus TaxID=417292 RepID=A0A1G8X696_9ACTN|nr:hypothetical protein SAMN05421806_10319 [Streptomyces indicus]